MVYRYGIGIERRFGVPRSEEERIVRHRALYGEYVLPPRGTGLVREGIPTAGRRFGVPRSEEQRERQHYAKYGTAELPPRGTGLRKSEVDAGNSRVVGMKREGELFMPIYSSGPSFSLGGVDEIYGKVIEIIDGNTFVMEGEETGQQYNVKIRGLNCPGEGSRNYNFAKNALSDLIQRGRRSMVTISDIEKGKDNIVVADVTFSRGDLARAMRKKTGSVCR